MSRKSGKIPRIRVTPEMQGKLERLAADDSRTMSDYVRLVLKQHLKSVECLRKLVDEHGLMTEEAFEADVRKNIFDRRKKHLVQRGRKE